MVAQGVLVPLVRVQILAGQPFDSDGFAILAHGRPSESNALSEPGESKGCSPRTGNPDFLKPKSFREVFSCDTIGPLRSRNPFLVKKQLGS